MPYNFTPRSEEELLELASEGNYNFTIISSEERISKKSGQLMAVIILQFYDSDGKSHEIEDYLSYMSKMDWKIKHLCDTCGKTDKWASGIFNAEQNNLERWKGTAKIFIDKTGERPKNKVKDYLPKGPSGDIQMPPPLNADEPLEILDDKNTIF